MCVQLNPLKTPLQKQFILCKGCLIMLHGSQDKQNKYINGYDRLIITELERAYGILNNQDTLVW